MKTASRYDYESTRTVFSLFNLICDPRVPSANDHQKIAAYHDRVVANPHHRYRSWEHCYRFFRFAEKDTAALQLGFYLASWGMYRGSSFLLQRTYTVHAAVVERLAAPEFAGLWESDVGTDTDPQTVDAILAAVVAVKEAYAPFGTDTDTLATKCFSARSHARLQWTASSSRASRHQAANTTNSTAASLRGS